MKICITVSFLFLFFYSSSAQDEPIWSIGTTWVYEYQKDYYVKDALTVKIIDTLTINGMKLYEVETDPPNYGIQYFYFEGDKVYSYREDLDLLTLLYDWTETEKYTLDYRPICDPAFDLEQDDFKTYFSYVDSLYSFTMPDNTTRNIQSVEVHDTLVENGESMLIYQDSRLILEHIGFLNGKIVSVHDWFLGDYVCDWTLGHALHLRCFENGDESYNFVGYPCDTTIVLSSSNENQILDVSIFPIPASGVIFLQSENDFDTYQWQNSFGKTIGGGEIIDQQILTPGVSGIYFLKLHRKENVVTKKIVVE